MAELESTRRKFLILLAAGLGAVEFVPEGQNRMSVELLRSEFEVVFSRLANQFPDTRIPAPTGQEAYTFRQGSYRYTLVKKHSITGLGSQRTLETTYFHGSGQDATNDPIIEYSLDDRNVAGNWLWWTRVPGREERGDRKDLSNREITVLSGRLKGNFLAWHQSRQ